MLSIAEYVKQRGISQTAVRRQLTRYEKELEGHTPKVNRRIMLDDYAIEFLDAHRMPREVIIQQASDEVQREINDLRARLDLMKDQMQQMQNHALSLQDEIINLQKEKIDLIADQTRNQLLLEARDKEAIDLQDRLETMDQDNRDLQSRLEEVEKEVSRYSKTWFGLYKRKED